MHVILTVVSGPRTGVKVRLRDKTAIIQKKVIAH